MARAPRRRPGPRRPGARCRATRSRPPLRGDPVPFGVLHDGPGLDQMAEHLGDEERVAVGLSVDRMCQRDAGVVEGVAGHRLHEGDHPGVVESAQGNHRHRGLAPEGTERLGEGMGDGELGVPVGARDEETCRGGMSHHTAQQLEGRLVGPVEVVEHHHHSGARRSPRRATPPQRRAAGSARCRGRPTPGAGKGPTRWAKVGTRRASSPP